MTIDFIFYQSDNVPTAAEMFAVFGAADPRMIHCHYSEPLAPRKKGTSLDQTASFEPSCAKIGSMVLAVNLRKNISMTSTSLSL